MALSFSGCAGNSIGRHLVSIENGITEIQFVPPLFDLIMLPQRLHPENGQFSIAGDMAYDLSSDTIAFIQFYSYSEIYVIR